MITSAIYIYHRKITVTLNLSLSTFIRLNVSSSVICLYKSTITLKLKQLFSVYNLNVVCLYVSVYWFDQSKQDTLGGYRMDGHVVNRYSRSSLRYNVHATTTVYHQLSVLIHAWSHICCLDYICSNIKFKEKGLLLVSLHGHTVPVFYLMK